MKTPSYLRTNRMIAVCIFVLITITVLSCNLNTNHKTPTNTELERNRELWAKSNICNYDLVIEGSGSYPVGIFEPVNIEVKDGVISNIEWALKNNNEKVTQGQREIIERQYGNYLSIEKLFDFIQYKTDEIKKIVNSGNSASGRLSVSYDASFGYPKEIDYVFFGADGSQSFKVKKLEILKAHTSCN